MNCPYCEHQESKVVDSRYIQEGIRRRRECLMCSLRFTTYEKVHSQLLNVIKKDQRMDYPAREIAIEVEKRWNKNFKNNIEVVVGQAWWAGNLSYHLKSRPKYIHGYLDFVKEKEVFKDINNVFCS